MSRLSSPGAWLGFLTAALATLLAFAIIPEAGVKYAHAAQALAGLALVWFFRRPPPTDGERIESPRGVVGPATVMALLLLALPAHAGEPSDVALNRAILAPAPVAADVAPSLAQQAALNACPEPCATCAAKVGVLVAPSWPTWAKVIVGIGTGIGGALTVYAQGHASGAW